MNLNGRSHNSSAPPLHDLEKPYIPINEITATATLLTKRTTLETQLSVSVQGVLAHVFASHVFELGKLRIGACGTRRALLVSAECPTTAAELLFVTIAWHLAVAEDATLRRAIACKRISTPTSGALLARFYSYNAGQRGTYSEPY